MDELAKAQLSDNRNERLPCVILVDGSNSMSGAPINLLNQGLKTLETDLKADDNAALRVQILLVRIGGDAQVLVDWTDARNFIAPTVVADGNTPLGQGVTLAMQRIQAQKDLLRASGVGYKRPWFFMMTDGEPTDDDAYWKAVAGQCRDEQARNKFTLFPIAVGSGANPQKLKEFGLDRPVVAVEAAKFREMFLFISGSARQASAGPAGATVSGGPWGQVVA